MACIPSWNSIADRVGLLAFNEWNLPIEKYRADVMDRF
jgi:hypothetical protein